MMEQIIYFELLRRGYSVDIGSIESMITNSLGKRQRATFEVDFVCNMGSKRIYIQAAYDIPNKDKMLQETKSFKLIDDSFTKIVIIKGRFAPSFDENGILYIGLYDFLEKDTLLEL